MSCVTNVIKDCRLAIKRADGKAPFCRRFSCLFADGNLNNGVSYPLVRRIVEHETAYR